VRMWTKFKRVRIGSRVGPGNVALDFVKAEEINILFH
jgi:hypothetical protein